MLIILYMIIVFDKCIERRNSFDLSLSFHRRQNLYAMEQFLPIASLHSLFYLVWFCNANSSVHQMRLYVQITPYYCFLCPLLFLILIRRGRFKRISHVHNMINPERNPNDFCFFLFFSSACG
ncbi:hypothetical protein PMAYCL1PPCAC_08202 [Pristionchus mayeri]|uniref:G protein-coupled receptor n=1 Tax=Pristionchus mayeri TaxID=1317129 RepID=A0AAN4ZEE1_9BILA|nr:hypothetical protein PMAYCL1PPCAC_08202 [Pristionchus mayeri]